MTLSAWWLLAAALPVLLLGQLLIRRVPGLARFDLPVPVVGGFVVAVGVLCWNLWASSKLDVQMKVAAPWWTWLVTAQGEWRDKKPAVPVFLPLSTLFFTCVGLNASWRVARTGSWQLLVLLGLATALAVMQNVLGVALAKWMGQSPLLGVVCGSLTLTGGPSTALGFAGEFEKAGFGQAGAVGAAAAMFGIVTGSLLGGPSGGRLIRRRALMPRWEGTSAAAADPVREKRIGGSFVRDVGRLTAVASPGALLAHLLLLLACVKLGAQLSHWMANHLPEITIGAQWKPIKLTFPVYMGAMLLAVLVRNVIDVVWDGAVRTDVVNAIATVSLAIFLAVAMAGLNLIDLRDLARPMIVILAAQVVLMLVFAYWLTFNLLGRDYDAAVASAGHVGFGLGITPNAVATMDVLISKFGPAPRALLIVTIVGAFLIDFTNAVTITVWLSLLR